MASTISTRDTLPIYQAEQFISRFDEFFGGSAPAPPAPAATFPGRENVNLSAAPLCPPPSYDAEDCPAPAYDQQQEPATVAQYLFRYGFFFPLFWIMGSLILFWDLQPTPEHECGKTAAEQADEILILRRAEIKWAKRSALALFTFILTIGLIIVGLYLGKVGVFHRR